MKFDNRTIIGLCVGSLIGAVLVQNTTILPIINTICIILLALNTVEKENK